MMAEIMFPMHTEIGESVVGAWVSNPEEIKMGQWKKLHLSLPEASFINFRRTGIKIEVPLSPKDRNKTAILKLAKTIRCAIQQSLGVTAGLCPVRDSTRIIRITRST